MNGKYLSHLLFLIVSGLASLYLAIEAALQAQGTSICAGEGCRAVSQYSRFGDLTLVLAGLAVLLLLAFLAAAGMRRERPALDLLVDATLIAALAAEGFLAGYQLFWLETVCTFCISVFALFVVLGLLRIAAGRRQVAAGFIALVVIMMLFLVVLPAGAPELPADAKLVLFYSTECKHCAEIREELDASGLKVTHLLSREYAATLRGLGVEEVPTLLVNGQYERVLLTGTKSIRRYLASCGAQAAPRAGRERNARTGTSQQRSTPAVPSPMPFGLFSAPGDTGSLLTVPADDGLCKEEQKCD